MPDTSPYVKTPAFAAFQALLFDLSRAKQLSPSAQPDPDEIRILPPGYSADYSRGKDTAFPLGNTTFPFRVRMNAGARALFDALFTAVLHSWATPAGSFGWGSNDWLITLNGKPDTLTTAQMLFAISVCRNWAILGDALEISLPEVLAPYIGQVPVQILPKKSANTAGPDAFFNAGGGNLGLPYAPFAVEAKAGDSALKKATTGIRSVAEPGKQSGASPRERYANHIRAMMATKYGVAAPAQFAILLVGVSYTLGSSRPQLPPDTGQFFDGVLLFNAWGQVIASGPAGSQ